MLLTPPPVTNCHTFSDHLPLERDVLYERPLVRLRLDLPNTVWNPAWTAIYGFTRRCWQKRNTKF